MADFEAGLYWSNEAASSDPRAILTVERATEKYARTLAGVWRHFAPNVPAITDAGLNLEPKWEGEPLLLAPRPAAAHAARTTFPAGLVPLGAVDALLRIAVVADVDALTASGMTDLVPQGLVYEVSNEAQVTHYVQVSVSAFPVENGRRQVGSWYARQVTGRPGVCLAKGGGRGTGVENVATSDTYARYAFTDSSDWQMEIVIPAGATFRFVLPSLEYLEEGFGGSVVPRQQRSADVVVPAPHS